MFVPSGTRLYGVRYERDTGHGDGALVIFDANQTAIAPETHRFAFSDADRAFLATTEKPHARLERILPTATLMCIANHMDGNHSVIQVLLAAPHGQPWVNLYVNRTYFAMS